MRACVSYVRARAWRRITDVSGAAAGMQRLCGAYAVAVGGIAHELAVACSTGSGYNAAQRSMRICMGEVPLSGIEFRVQGAGCRCKAS